MEVVVTAGPGEQGLEESMRRSNGMAGVRKTLIIPRKEEHGRIDLYFGKIIANTKLKPPKTICPFKEW